MSQQEDDTKLISDDGEEFNPFSVILGRDLIFMDWTVQFGSQILGIIVGGLLGFIVGVNVFSGLFGGSEQISATVYTVFQVGIALSVLGLSLYFINRLGLKINSPKSISGNGVNILKIAFFGLTFIFGLSYIYNEHLAPAVHRRAGIAPPGGNGTNGENGSSGTIDFNTTNEYIILLMVLMITTAIFALLYAGIVYTLNRRVRTL
ncbi:MAG: hypothetical protein ACXABK_01365, partial [Candidatus Heimdallarchaeaceae archaeon]